MSGVDRVFVCILIAVILFCFYMNGKWWFFVAGICTSVAFALIMGFLLQAFSQRKKESEWNSFLDTLGEDKPGKTSDKSPGSTEE